MYNNIICEIGLHSGGSLRCISSYSIQHPPAIVLIIDSHTSFGNNIIIMRNIELNFFPSQNNWLCIDKNNDIPTSDLICVGTLPTDYKQKYLYFVVSIAKQPCSSSSTDLRWTPHQPSRGYIFLVLIDIKRALWRLPSSFVLIQTAPRRLHVELTTGTVD